MTARDPRTPLTLRQRLARTLSQIALRLGPRDDDVAAAGGALLQFIPFGQSLGYPRYRVVSVRGGMDMGTVEWSNQWNRPRFKPHPEAVFDQQCLAEIYACMRGMR